jgi:hypothetical protein
MRRMLIITLTALFAVTGCESRQHKLDQLNAQYKTLNQKYFDECIAPIQGGTAAYFKDEKKKRATPAEETAQNQKCALELKQVTSLEQRIAALSK